jgi:hemerythrin-like metal-binding protein
MAFEWTDEWSDKFSVGVPILDRQHRMLLSLVRDAADMVMQKDGNEAKFSAVLNEMQRYADVHFQTEEALLERFGYPDLSGQREEHHSYLETLAEMEAALHSGSIPRIEVHDFLLKWWYEHVLIEDMAYKDFLVEAGAGVEI